MSKKVLSLAVAVLMLVSVFAVSASAFSKGTYPAQAESGVWEMGLRVVTDAYVGMPAGETVTAKVYYVINDSFPYPGSVSNIPLVYSGGAFEVNSTSRTWGASYDFFKETATVNVNQALLTNASTNKATSSRDTAILEDSSAKIVMVQLAYDTTNPYGYKATTGFPIDTTCEVFSIQFTTLRTVTADDIICVLESDIKVNNTQYRDTDQGKNITTVVSGGNYWGEWGYAPANTVVMGETAACKMRPNAENAGNYDLGFTCTWKDVSIAGTNVDTSAGTTAIDAIGVDYRVNGTIVAGVANAADSTLKNQVYSIAGGYAFRSALKNIPAADMGEKIEARGYITVGGTTYYSQWQQINAATVKAAAHANGMA